MAKKISTVGAIAKVTKEMGKSGEVAKVSIVVPGDQATLIPLGTVIITIQASQKEITFGAGATDKSDDDE